MIKPVAYFKPDSLAEAVEALQNENARPIAGGTDLIINMRNGTENPGLLVDVKGLDELDVFSANGKSGITIGARVNLNFLIDDAKLRNICPVLGESALSVATYQLRNRATLIGNLCNASPAADMAPAMYVLGAGVVITGPHGERKMLISDFITGVKRTALGKGELVVKVEIPEIPDGKMAFLKKQRCRGHDLATVNVAGIADPAAKTLKICIGACAVTPVLLKGTDELYRETDNVDELADRAAELARKSIAPIDDVRSSAEYRRDMASVYVKRLIRKICS
ncbi:MAG: xanthine dehydrogenase family protein subunit M [Spirochaetes bacterium]|nr:xanthine dehydrogenase family protein subunit M [Spirochaetota bacterium]